MKIKGKIIFLVLIGLVFPSSVFSFVPQLDYPELFGIDIEELIRTGQFNLAHFGIWLYYLFLSLGAVAAFIGLILGGIKWMLSESFFEISEAKKQVFFSFIGLTLLLGSWIILHTIDPGLVEPPELGGPPMVPAPAIVEEEPLKDGYYIYYHNPYSPDGEGKFRAIKGELRIEDTRNVAGASIPNLSGRTPGGAINLDLPHIKEIQFVLPVDPDSAAKIQAGHWLAPSLIPLYHYGVACYENPNFQGVITIKTSLHVGCYYEEGKAFIECEKVPLYISGPPGFDIVPCGSILSFRIPKESIFSFGDSFTFYEYPYPQRIRKVPEPTLIPGQPGILGIELVGGCIEIGERADLDCAKGISAMDLGSALLPATFDLFGINLCQNLLGETLDPETGEVERIWYPKSLQILTDRAGKYLVFLFPDIIVERRSEMMWKFGPAYHFQADVNNFLNTEDIERLYWLSGTPDNIPFTVTGLWPAGPVGSRLEWLRELRAHPDYDKFSQDLEEAFWLPKSCIIIPVERIF